MSRLERIVAACGGVLFDGGKRALIPGLNHSHKDRSVSLVETEEGRILIHCFSPKDDWRKVRRALAEKHLLDNGTSMDPQRADGSVHGIAAQPADEDRLARAQRIWNESRPIRHTPATVYLRQRAIPESLWSTPALRFHARMTSLDDRVRRPALVAAIANAAGELQGVQVTLLTAHGAAKAPVPTPRRVIGRLLGGAVQLMNATKTLVVAEGVESALSASAAHQAPAWAALTARNLSLFEPPNRLARLIIAADADEAGLAAARRLQESAPMIAEISAPAAPHSDWNERALAGSDKS